MNAPRRQQHLMMDLKRWSQICVCMDVISDSEQAIRGYLGQTTNDKDILYLTTYGVLQAFVVQQDAILHLAAAIEHPVDGWARKKEKMDWSRRPELLRIRTVRIRAVGHPSKTDPIKAGPEGYHVIVQHSCHVGYFEIMSWNGVDDVRLPVDVTELAAVQQDCVGALLGQLRNAIAKDGFEGQPI